MYHPTRGGVRGGRDQFKWDDVKVDKHRENYLGHSIMAPVGRWQKGKDLHWYTRDKKSAADEEAAKEEIRRIKEQEEQAMREALGLAPKSSTRSQGNRLDKYEYQELVKKGSTAEDLGEGHSDAVKVSGLGFAREPRAWELPSTLPSNTTEVLPEKIDTVPPTSIVTEEKVGVEVESKFKKRDREERKAEKHEKRNSRDSDDRRKHKKENEKRRHESERGRDDGKKHKKDRDRRRHDSDTH